MQKGVKGKLRGMMDKLNLNNNANQPGDSEDEDD